MCVCVCVCVCVCLTLCVFDFVCVWCDREGGVFATSCCHTLTDHAGGKEKCYTSAYFLNTVQT